MSINPLTNKELKEQAPTLFTEQPHSNVSDKYHFIPTIDVIEEIKLNNWYPVTVSQAKVRDEEKEGTQQHMVRFRHFDDLLNPQENAVELFNSHDRSKSFSISAGVYRFVCANGLVVADSIFETYKIRHLGEKANDVVTAVNNISAIKPKLISNITQLESIILSPEEKESFAKSSIPLRFDSHLKVDHNNLLISHRVEDNKDDLYTILNIIQENLLRGNVSGINKDTKRKFTSKRISSISKDVEINKGLWELAQRIAFIKEHHIALAA